MKNATTKITCMLIGLSILLSACENSKIRPSSNITIQDRTIEDYSGLEISTAFTVDVTFSETEEKIEIETNENLHAYVDVVKSGNNLVIRLKENTNISGSTTLKAHITTANTFNEISVEDASLLTFNNLLDVINVDLSLSDASNFNGGIVANSIIANLDDASKATFEGSADEFIINASGASTLGSYEMNVNKVICELYGASQASLTVIGSIDLTASDASVFMYKGDAQIIDLNLSGAAQIIKVD